MEKPSQCSANEDSYLKDAVEHMDKKIEGILNQTIGMYSVYIDIQYKKQQHILYAHTNLNTNRSWYSELDQGCS